MKNKIFCTFLSLLMICNYGSYGNSSKEQQENLISDNNNFTNYKIKKYLPFVLTATVIPIGGYFIHSGLKTNNNVPNLNQLKPLYIKKLNKLTLRIIRYGDANTGLLIANTKEDPFVVKDKNGNNLTTAIVSPNNQACQDGALAGAIENKGGNDVKDDKQKWIKEGQDRNFGIDNYTGKPIAIKYGEAKLGRPGNFKELKNIIHTVGPYVPSGVPTSEQEEQLKNSYINSLKLAAQNDIHRIVFPPISLGVFNFPIVKGTDIPIQSIKEFSKGDTGSLEYIDIWMINDGNKYPFLVKSIGILGVPDDISDRK